MSVEQKLDHKQEGSNSFLPSRALVSCFPSLNFQFSKHSLVELTSKSCENVCEEVLFICVLLGQLGLVM